jgi:hypothetical protein
MNSVINKLVSYRSNTLIFYNLGNNMNIKQSWERHNKEVIVNTRITLELFFYVFIILSPFILMHLQFASL